METETITSYEESTSKLFVDTMDATFKASGASAYIDESHTDITDDEEDVPLNLDCSKSDDDDDLGDSDHHEVSDDENATEADLKGDQNSKDAIQIDTSNDKLREDHDKNHTDDKEELQSSDNQTKTDEPGKDTIKDKDRSHNDDKQDISNLDCPESKKEQVDVDPVKSDEHETNDDKTNNVNEVEGVAVEKESSQNKDNVEKGKNEEETPEKDSKGEVENESKGDQNSKEAIQSDTSNEEVLENIDKNHADDKEELQNSDNQTNKDEPEKDTTEDTDGSCPGSKNKQDDVDSAKSDHHETNDDKAKSTNEVGGASAEKEGSQNKENAENGKNEETPQKDGKSEAEVGPKDDSENNDKEGDKYSLLKETLSKPSDAAKEQENNDEEMDEDFDPSDFDPSLLCPEVAMEVEEAPVISPANDNSQSNDDGAKSPILFDAVFSTYVDEMTGTETCFDLTPEEDKLRQETYGQRNPIQYTKIHCTACNVHLGSALDGQGNRFVHPLLKVLICKNCYFFYSSGEFERDEDGSELYCRWCGQGGQVMCCSKCEMVFCKKCIRINFDRKKIADIRDSDDWLCFRCNPSQITHLKIHCAEFMEYVRRERSRAATLENCASFTNTDHALCCQSLKKKATDSPADQPKRKRKRVAVVDPDYNPLKDLEDDHKEIEKVPHTITPPTSVNATSTPRTVPAVPPRVNGVPSSNVAQQVRPGVSPFRPKAPQQQFSVRPRLQTVGQNAVSVQAQRATAGPSPGYIKILPGGMVVPGNAPRQVRVVTPRPQTTTLRQQSPTQTIVRPRGQATQNQSQTKHEWFEKTVRAAARVNSNLSYTLTNLNRAQAAASSVEALAVVHNKLQEILSTSINSLIQIRKNLRAEFIQGIKNARFPPKPQPPGTSTTPTTKNTSDQDDDVIIISPASSPIPSAKVGPVSGSSRPSTSRFAASDKAGGRPFLRVKSLTALQNVTAECITIPDDPPEVEKPTEVAIDAKKKGLDSTKVIKVDITKILAGEDPAVVSNSSKEENSKEADKNVDEAVIPVSAPEISKAKSREKKENCKSKDEAAVEEISDDKNKTDSEEGKSKDKTNVEKTSDGKESEEKEVSPDEEKTKDKTSLEKMSDGKESEEKEVTPDEEKTKDKSSVEKMSNEKESAETEVMSDEVKTKDKTNVEETSDKMESEEQEVMPEEEPTKRSSNRSSPALKTLQDFKVVLERSKEIDGCVMKKTD